MNDPIQRKTGAGISATQTKDNTINNSLNVFTFKDKTKIMLTSLKITKERDMHALYAAVVVSSEKRRRSGQEGKQE